MKNILAFCIVCGLVLNTAESISHQNAMKTFKNSIYEPCFATFHTSMNTMNNMLKKASRRCFFIANTEIDREERKSQMNRTNKLVEIKRFKESMNNCTSNVNRHEYSECLSKSIIAHREIVDSISKSFDITPRGRSIREEERSCLQNTVNRNEGRSLQAYRDLTYCINNLLF